MGKNIQDPGTILLKITFFSFHMICMVYVQIKPCISEISSAKDSSYHQEIFQRGHCKTMNQKLMIRSNQTYRQ